MSINYKHRLKKKLENDHGVFVLSKILYSNQEELRLKKLYEHEFGFAEQLYFSQIYIIHLLQPYLKSRYGAYLSKGMIQGSKTRYAIKITNAEVDLIFIMNGDNIDLILVDPFKHIKQSEIEPNSYKQVLTELSSFYIFYQVCMELDCLSIARYWNFIRTLAVRYDFYPRKIFHEEDPVTLKDLKLGDIEPGFCLYSGEPIEEGYFKDSKASSDFFNPRYSKEGLFGKKVLLYTESLEAEIDSDLKQHQEKLDKQFKNEVKGYSQHDKEVHASEIFNWNESFTIESNRLMQLSSDCAHEISKKINTIKDKFYNKKQRGNVTANNTIRHLGEYFLPGKHSDDLDILDILLLMPKINSRTYKTLSEGENLRDSRLGGLIYSLNSAKSIYCKQNGLSPQEFYDKLSKVTVSKLTSEPLKIVEIEQLIKHEIDPFSYPKMLSIYRSLNIEAKTYSIKLIYPDESLLEILNLLLKLIRPERHIEDSSKYRFRLISEELFRFNKKIIESQIKYLLQKRIDKA